MNITRLASCTLAFLVSACSGNVDPSDPDLAGATSGSAMIGNSELCAPLVVDTDTGGTENGAGDGDFPVEGEQAALYTCGGSAEVEISGRVCLCGDDETCFFDVDLVPANEPAGEEPVIGVPVPSFTSSLEMYPDPELGACCVAPSENVDPSNLEEALEAQCEADCAARACAAAAEELAAIFADMACRLDTFNADACRLELEEVCIPSNDDGCPALCGTPRLLGKTIGDLDQVLKAMQTPEAFQSCRDSIASPGGWRPCLTLYPECYENPWPNGNGRILDLVFRADCSDIAPISLDAEGHPEPETCDSNPNANPETAWSGEGFVGLLGGGGLSLQTPLGNATTQVVGSDIAFRRLPCTASVCAFSLTALDVEFDSFEIGPFVVSSIEAELRGPATGALRADTTAVIDHGAMRMLITATVGTKNPNASKGGLPLLFLAVNEGPVTLVIDDSNNIEIIDATFNFPFKAKARLSTATTNCTPE